MGDVFNTTVDVGEWWTMVIAAHQEAEWWFTWGFDSNHLVYFDACPDTEGSIRIVNQRAERNAQGGVTRHATFRNDGNNPVAFRPRCIIAPKR
jgi:hypothetical protein